MDRLLCGDVGFGKTEVAIRAAFKAIEDGKQVAVLAPTTMLASSTATRSPSASPTTRPRRGAQPLPHAGKAKKVVAGLANGEVDIVIGTHRLLPDGVHFKDLGMLVVDEEQRFGVKHKEAMKKLKANVDVLRCPPRRSRARSNGLVGMRDLSMLPTPPADRQPILTYVGEYDERSRRGDPPRAAARGPGVLPAQPGATIYRSPQGCGLVPEARIAVAHGQMDEGTLEQVVVDFGKALRRARLHDDHRDGHRHADRNTLVVDARTSSASARCTSSRPGRPQRTRGRTLTCSTRANAS